jgi:hypothetical protein
MSEIGPNTASRIAIEFLTLWMEQDRDGAIEHIVRVLNEPNAPDAGVIIAGQCNLAMALAMKLAAERGAVTLDELRTKAGEIVQEVSRALEYLPD